MSHQNNKTIEDFLQDPSFRGWVLQGIDNDKWENWLKEAQDGPEMAREAQIILLSMGVSTTEISDTEIEMALADTWKKVEVRQPQNKNSARRHSAWFYAAASFLLFAIGLTWHLIQKPMDLTSLHSNLLGKNIILKKNNSHTPLLITLHDGSSVVLQPQSELRYPATFKTDERHVVLHGEAFFEITKNPSSPFIVYTEEITTRVTGTSFKIKAYRTHPNVEVAVKTGEVKISTLHPKNTRTLQEVSLKPNESLRYSRKYTSFEKKAHTTFTESMLIEQLKFDFTDAPVSEIFERIEMAYGLKVDYPSHILKDCYLSTFLEDMPLQQKLKIICESLGSHTNYEIKENQITIFSRGCN